MTQTVLGFDFGMKYIGVATGDFITRTATPHCSIAAKDGIPDWEIINKLITQWNPSILVVGLPLNMDGTEQLMTQRANKFSNRLRNKYKLKVVMIDETLTTWDAKNTITNKRDFNKVNATAAAIILEDYLQAN